MAFTRACGDLINDIRDLQAVLRRLRNVAKKEKATGNYSTSVASLLGELSTITINMLAV